MTTDPFAPARRAIWTGALAALAGSLLAVLGIGGTGWILIVPGVLLFVIGVLRLLRGSWTIALERQRQALLRAGVQGTATVISSHQVATRFAHPIYEMELTVTGPEHG